jgi:hypothetical protein
VSIESLAFNALKGLVSNKVYPDVNDAGTSAPYIVYGRVGGQAPGFLENTLPSKENARVQVTSWHSTRLGAQTLCGQVLTALVALGWRPVGAPVSLYDQQTKLRGAAQDFTAWADR